jgi:hypothetical protein
VWRTFERLLAAPGALTESYLGGNDHYLRPTRLYLLTSLVLFGLTSAADPGAALGGAMLAQERAWLASGDPSAVRELEEDLERLAGAAERDGAEAEERARELLELLADVRRGERHPEAATAIAGAGAGEADRMGSWLEDAYLAEEDLARAQSATAGRVLEWLPFALILLVPLHAAGLHLLGPGRGTGERPSGVAAAALSIHGHAFAFVAFAAVVGVAWATGWTLASVLLAPPLALVAVLVWQALALRRVYGSGRRRAALVSVGWGAAYGLAVLVVLVAVWSVAFVAG